MGYSTTLLLLIALVLQVHSAPQLLDLTNGKLGVNFGGYHAAVGLGGVLGGSGPAGGLFAEAGTPHGQAAKAGLGGAVDGNSGPAGGLYAGATAGHGIKASTGLAGGVTGEKTAGTGYAEAQAGNHYAASGLGGETSVDGASGFKFSGTKSFGSSTGVIEEKEVLAQPVETVKPSYQKVNTNFNVEANEFNAVPLTSVSKTKLRTDVKVKTKVQPTVVVKEVYAQPPPVLVEKQIVRTHYKPRRTHFRKTAYLGGYIGSDVPPPPPVYISSNPIIEKRIDVGVDGSAGAVANAQAAGAGEVAYTKQVTYQRNPTFFADIFNIPISTLKAVGNLLGNTAGSTNVSVQKSAILHAGGHADSDSESPKHASSSVSSSETQVSIQTPPASKLIDDIFAIPINTLGAVNKFLENNVGRKKVQVSQDGAGEPTKVRLGPHARRRANKQVVIIEDNVEQSDSKSEDGNQ